MRATSDDLHQTCAKACELVPTRTGWPHPILSSARRGARCPQLTDAGHGARALIPTMCRGISNESSDCWVWSRRPRAAKGGCVLTRPLPEARPAPSRRREKPAPRRARYRRRAGRVRCGQSIPSSASKTRTSPSRRGPLETSSENPARRPRLAANRATPWSRAPRESRKAALPRRRCRRARCERDERQPALRAPRTCADPHRCRRPLRHVPSAESLVQGPPAGPRGGRG